MKMTHAATSVNEDDLQVLEPADAVVREREAMQAEMDARLARHQGERPRHEGWEEDSRAIEDDQSYWLMTMVDLMTLLLTLFVLLAAYAYHQKNTVPAVPGSGQQTRVTGRLMPIIPLPGDNLPVASTAKTTKAAHHPQSAPHQTTPTHEKTASTDELQQKKQQASRMFSGLGKDVDVSVVKGKVNLRVRDNILFSTGDAALSGGGSQLIGKLAQRLKQGHYRISVEGHSDNRPIHTATYPSNWELSAARAASVVRKLVASGVDPDRLSAVGYADTQPIANNDTAAGQAANRRVDLVLHLPAQSAPKPNKAPKASNRQSGSPPN